MEPAPRQKSRLIMTLIGFGLALILLLLAGAYLASRMPGSSYAGRPSALTSAQIDLRSRLEAHILALAEGIGERHIWRPDRLEAAAVYIENSFRAAGLNPREVSYQVGQTMVRNIEVNIPGTSPSPKTYVVGAHYDTVSGTPGANDNATGVAALIELARAFQRAAPVNTIRCVAFVNEEPPFFKTDQMGSRVYAQALKQEQVDIDGMLSLETIGYFSQAAGSQKFPLPPLKLFYPNQGNFLAFVGNFSSRQFLTRMLAGFRRTAEVPSEGLAAPGWVTGVDWSDHWSFWQEDWPAIMLTDTAIFRYPHYHGSQDTPERIDYNNLARIVSGLQTTLRQL